MSYESLISLRYLRSRTGRGFVSLTGLISVLGVFLGVTSLNVVLSVMKGFEEELRDKIIGASSHVVVMSYDGDFGDYERLGKKLESLSGVVAASPFVYGQGMLVTEHAVAGSVVRGIDPRNSASVAALAEAAGKGTFPGLDAPAGVLAEKGARVVSGLASADETADPPVILGRELAGSVGVAPGGSVSLVSPYGKIGPFGPTAKVRKFAVAGIFDYGMLEHDSSTAYVSLADAMDFFGTPGKVSGIEVRVEDIYRAKATGEEIESELGFPFYARNWEDANSSLFRALRLERMAIAIFLGFIVLVAALNIVSTLTMLVMEKKRDVSVLLAMGARRSGVRRIFVYDGMMIGGVGTLLGTLFGYAVCYFLQTSNFVKRMIPFDDRVYPISEFPVKIEPLYFLAVAACSLLVCFLATLYPSWSASGRNPVETLRHE